MQMTPDPQMPQPGVPEMPRWNKGELPDAPLFTRRNWIAMIGPGIILGAAAIGGGEWLLGPKVTAKYGGALLWLATLSILGQTLYNIEISRYTLYCGEPIFTGKFRLHPGPRFWFFTYLLLDLGSIFPYLASNAAVPIVTVIKGGVLPDPANVSADYWMMKGFAWAIFLGGTACLLFGGKVYNALKAIMTFKIFAVLGFLLILAIFFSTPATWVEIGTGFFKFGTFPIKVDEGVPVVRGSNVDNLFFSLWEGRGIPDFDFSLIAFIAGLAAIAGSGGLTNIPISNYTREQGWGMGRHVGAIPSMIGGHKLELAHEGTVFEPTADSLPKWRRWLHHVRRDQLAIFLPACFIGLALPCVLSVQFLPPGYEPPSDEAMAAMTAGSVGDHVASVIGPAFGNLFWFMTLFCGFLVLGLAVVPTAEGLIRRWVEVTWTSSARLRKFEPKDIKKVYFTVLAAYAVFGMIMLSFERPSRLVTYATMFYNIALGFSCWHTLAVNTRLLPPPLRPGWIIRILLILAGAFFWTLGIVTILDRTGLLVRIVG
jgi:Mn2+/Fe2+ NRAMP family transporter